MRNFEILGNLWDFGGKYWHCAWPSNVRPLIKLVMSDLLRHSLVIWLKILILGVTCESFNKSWGILGHFWFLGIFEI